MPMLWIVFTLDIQVFVRGLTAVYVCDKLARHHYVGGVEGAFYTLYLLETLIVVELRVFEELDG
jgi:hypothetical protein